MASIREQFLVFLARTGLQAKARRKAIRQFSGRNGFVYFGSVDQHTDDHQVIRGFSASLTHADDSYTVGAYDGYDVTMVDRSDIVPIENGKTETHQWLIAEFKLQLAKDIPHFFLIPTHHGATHYRKVFDSLRALEKVNLSHHSAEFVNRYDAFCVPAHAVDVDDLLSPEITQTIAAHFWPFALEVWEGAVYVYAVEPKLDNHILNTIIKNGVWLAQTLDSKTVL
jgi:hypothetical protein